MAPRIPGYLVALSAAGAALGGFVLFRDRMVYTYDGMEKITGRTVIVTGANCGMGKELSKELATRGGRILMACRDLEKCEAARREIIEATFNRNIECKKLDLASLKSVRDFAKDINENEKRLDILINNAGVMRCPYSLTEDGFETQLGVNHLGHFLLTNLLLDKLKACRPSRIINTASLAYKRGRINFKDLNSATRYNNTDAFAQSKLAVMLFNFELAKRLDGTGVSTYAVNPGLVKTDIGRHLSVNNSFLSTIILGPFSWLTMLTPREGIQTALYCTLSQETADISGKYWTCLEMFEVDPKFVNEKTAHRLWLVSERWTQERTDSP